MLLAVRRQTGRQAGKQVAEGAFVVGGVCGNDIGILSGQMR